MKPPAEPDPGMDVKTATSTRSEAWQLTQLPTELLLEIIEHLRPCDMFLLSHTCKRLRQLTTGDWIDWRDEASRIQRADFDAAIGFVALNRWFCGVCKRLHRVTYNDTPQHSQYWCVGMCRRMNLDFPMSYRVIKNHVQLALQYTRLLPSLTSQHKLYLRSLMASAVQDGIDCGGGLKLMYKAEPRVTDGVFLLYEDYLVYRPKDGNDGGDVCPFTSKDSFACELCPHKTIDDKKRGRSRGSKRLAEEWHLSSNPPNNPPSWIFEDDIDDALTDHCPHCATDFSVHVYVDDEEHEVWGLHLRVWSALGTDTSEEDNHFKVHSFHDFQSMNRDSEFYEDWYYPSYSDAPELWPFPSASHRGTYGPGDVKRHWEKSGDSHCVPKLPSANGDPLHRPHPKLWDWVPADLELSPEEEELRRARKRGVLSTRSRHFHWFGEQEYLLIKSYTGTIGSGYWTFTHWQAIRCSSSLPRIGTGAQGRR